MNGAANINRETNMGNRSITESRAKASTRRMQKGGDLYIRPLSREEMTAPLAWHEKQLAVVRRYGILADGSIGFAKVA
jgi:hypothetical protein